MGAAGKDTEAKGRTKRRNRRFKEGNTEEEEEERNCLSTRTIV